MGRSVLILLTNPTLPKKGGGRGDFRAQAKAIKPRSLREGKKGIGREKGARGIIGVVHYINVFFKEYHPY